MKELMIIEVDPHPLTLYYDAVTDAYWGFEGEKLVGGYICPVCEGDGCEDCNKGILNLMPDGFTSERIQTAIRQYDEAERRYTNLLLQRRYGYPKTFDIRDFWIGGQ